MLYERGDGAFVGIWGGSTVTSTLALEVSAVCDLFGGQFGRGDSRTDPGYYSAAAEPGRFVIVGVSHPGGREGIGGYWNRPDWRVWWEVATSRRMR